MQTLICATGNTVKFAIGEKIFSKNGLKLEQIVIDIDEIQGKDPEVIIKDKARKAYEAVGKPVVVTDDSWSIEALNGFPGPYMKSINHWFTPDDFIRLMEGLENRRITLIQMLAYQDELETVIFRSDILGEINRVPKGKFGVPIMKVAALKIDNGKTISEVYDDNGGVTDNLLRESGAWNELADWYKQKIRT